MHHYRTTYSPYQDTARLTSRAQAGAVMAGFAAAAWLVGLPMLVYFMSH